MKKIKKVAKVLAVAGIATSILVGCGAKKEEKTSGDGDKVKLTMAWWGSQARHDATVKVIDMYEKQNPNVKIEPEFYDFDGYVTKLNVATAADKVWDIWQIAGNYPAYLNNIEPLDTYIDKGLIDTKDTSEAYLKTTQRDGKQLGLSNGMNAYAIAYDPELFKKAGIEEPTTDWTWEDFEKICLKIKEKLNIYGFELEQLDDFYPGASVGVGQYGGGLNFYDKDDDAKLGFDKSNLLSPYFKMRKTLVDAGAMPDSGAIAEVKDIENSYLVKKESAMKWIASNQVNALGQAANREIKLITLPKRKEDVGSTALMSSQMLCIAKNSKYKEEVAKFINFFQNDIEANKILNGERGVPIMEKVREELKKDATDTLKSTFDYIELVGEKGNSEINTVENPNNAIIRDQYLLLLQQVIAGEMKPDAAAKEIYDFAKEKVKEAK
ncbi:ABC transporter substrate-binding protein [Pseudolactococcus yaeyamensis]